MKIIYMSDLHLEHAQMSEISGNCDVLVFAGDIAAYPEQVYEFFERKVPRNVPCIYVLGNHEYEYQDIRKGADFFKGLLKPFSNVHLLQNDSVEINDVVFIGSTLWSNFEGEGKYRREALMDWASNIGDFNRIYSEFDFVTPSEMAELSNQSRDYILQEAKKHSGKKIVVVTHFAPCLESRELVGKSGFGYWVNDMDELLDVSDLHIHGHVHTTKDYVKRNSRVVCNARGVSAMYDLSPNLEFSVDKVVEI